MAAAFQSPFWTDARRNSRPHNKHKMESLIKRPTSTGIRQLSVCDGHGRQRGDAFSVAGSTRIQPVWLRGLRSCCARYEQSRPIPKAKRCTASPGLRLPAHAFAWLVFLLAALVGFGSQQLAAQEPVHVKPADTSSPRATLNSFIDSCNALHRIIESDRFFDRTSNAHRPIAMRVYDCLDISQLPEYERLEAAGEAAICLKEILDRAELPADSEIPDADAIRSAGGLEQLSYWRIPGTRITIARVEEGPQRHEYLFSPGTVGRAVEYYEDLKSFPYRTTGRETSPGFFDWYMTAPGHPMVASIVDRLPVWWRQRTFDLARWKWLGLLLATPLAMALMLLAYRLHHRLAGRYRNDSLSGYFLTIVFPVVAMLVPLGYKAVAYNYLTLRGQPLYVISFIANLAAFLCSLVVVFGASNRIAAVIIASPQINPRGLDAQFIRIMSKLLSIIAAAIIFLEGGRYLGIPVTTLLASAGVGGLAVALAAQDTLKNLFGTIMLLTDKPFRVGERIIFDKYDGVVEDIGLRSTRLRLLTGHQATVPNEQLATTDIENVGRRPYIRRSGVLELPSGSPIADVRRALEIVRTALKDHEGMSEDFPPRVYLRDLKEASIGIFFMYWYHPPDYWDFLALSERINLQIMEQLESERIRFAMPALNVQMSDGAKQPH